MKNLFVHIILFSTIATVPGASSFAKVTPESLHEELQNAGPADSLRIYHQLGDLYFDRDLYEKALETYFLLQNAARGQQKEKILGDASNSIGRIYYHMENYELALRYYRTARGLFENTRDSASLRGVLNNIGLVMYELDSLDEALDHYFRSLTMDRDGEHLLNDASIYHNIALIYNYQQKYDSAIVFLNQSLGIFRALRRAKLVANTYNNLGRSHHKAGNDLWALAYFDSAYAVADTLNAGFLIMDNFRYKADSYLHLEDYGNAYKFMNLYYLKKDSLFSLEKNRQLNEVRTRYESEIKEKENKLLKQENRNKAEVIHYQYLAGATVLIVAILLFVLLVIYYRSYRQKQKANQQLEQQKMAIEAQKIELERLNAEITSQKKDLELLNGIKDKLFSIISHEFKSPLNTLKGTLSLIRSDAISADELKSLSLDINDKVNNISIFLDNLLNWAKSQMEGIKARPESLAVRPIIEENVELLSTQARKKSIVVENSVPEGIRVYADDDMTRLVVRNLLSNALKFTRTGGTVSVSTSETDDLVQIDVADNGVGIAEDKLRELFSLKSPTTVGTDNEKGTGLGLMLSKDFVELNGGRIEVDSTPGEGTVFRISLPKQHRS